MTVVNAMLNDPDHHERRDTRRYHQDIAHVTHDVLVKSTGADEGPAFEIVLQAEAAHLHPPSSALSFQAVESMHENRTPDVIVATGPVSKLMPGCISIWASVARISASPGSAETNRRRRWAGRDELSLESRIEWVTAYISFCQNRVLECLEETVRFPVRDATIRRPKECFPSLISMALASLKKKSMTNLQAAECISWCYDSRLINSTTLSVKSLIIFLVEKSNARLSLGVCELEDKMKQGNYVCDDYESEWIIEAVNMLSPMLINQEYVNDEGGTEVRKVRADLVDTLHLGVRALFEFATKNFQMLQNAQKAQNTKAANESSTNESFEESAIPLCKYESNFVLSHLRLSRHYKVSELERNMSKLYVTEEKILADCETAKKWAQDELGTPLTIMLNHINKRRENGGPCVIKLTADMFEKGGEIWTCLQDVDLYCKLHFSTSYPIIPPRFEFAPMSMWHVAIDWKTGVLNTDVMQCIEIKGEGDLMYGTLPFLRLCLEYLIDLLENPCLGYHFCLNFDALLSYDRYLGNQTSSMVDHFKTFKDAAVARSKQLRINPVEMWDGR